MGCVQSEWNDDDKHEIGELGAGVYDLLGNQTLNINKQLILKTNNTDLKLFMDQGKF